jgi:alpha-glucosidase
VGGYAGTPPPDLLTKWLEVAAFQPIDRDHTEKGTADQEPWVGGAQQEAIRRHFIEERYRLMPYLYTLAEEASRTGLPIVRPLFLEYPDAAPDHHPIDVDLPASAEFLLGRDLLIAPNPYPEELGDYTVELPSADWYDYWTGARVDKPASTAGSSQPEGSPDQASASIQVHPELDKLPVFVHAGSIVPIAPLVQSTSETPQGPLTLRIYVGDDCGGQVYQDDGKTYAYQHGVYLRMNVSCQATAQGLLLKIGPHEGSFTPWWKQLRIEIYGWTPKQSIVVINGKAAAAPLHRFKQYVSLTLPDDGKGQDVRIS